MARAGHKYPLIVYRHLLNRWWPPLIAMGLGMFLLAYSESIDPVGQFLPQRWQLLAAIGALSIFTGMLFWALRYFAYVRPYPTYLKLVTPFIRINISYARIRKTTATEMRYLFSRKSMSGWVWEIFTPLANQTAVLVELSAYPLHPLVLRLFLHRFFFKDATPHLVLLIGDWMRFSSELESLRSGIDSSPPRQKRTRDSLLSRLPHK